MLQPTRTERRIPITHLLYNDSVNDGHTYRHDLLLREYPAVNKVSCLVGG